MIRLDSKIPEGPIAEKWTNHKFNMKLVNPANKRKFDIIVVGTGLAGASAAASLGALGYNVKAFTYHDSGKRAHSIAAQGGINAAKNYQNDGIYLLKTISTTFHIEISELYTYIISYCVLLLLSKFNGCCNSRADSLTGSTPKNTTYNRCGNSCYILSNAHNI